MKRSKFNLSNYKLLSCDMGQLVPCGLTEVLPGDTIQHATSALVRVSPLLAPVMHPVHIRIHHWFVPHRLVWEDWEDFITGGRDGLNASQFPLITMNSATSGAIGNLGDYLGVPPAVSGLEVSALPFRGYSLIWNEWYRDQDLQAELTIDRTSGPDTTTNTDLKNVGWEKDYFTSARPWTQKGPEVTIPLVGDAPVTGIGKVTGTYGGASTNVRETGGAGTVNYPLNDNAVIGTAADETFRVREDANNPGFPGIYADLSNVSAASINDLRLAFALQRYEEARARYGSRYTEYLRYLGVRSSDARLQRPEYLGGGKQTLQFSEVLQTAISESETPEGTMRGHGIGAVRSNRYRKFFEEHGYVFTFMSVKPKTMYVQGLPRTFNRRVKEDFWQKELEHIGQQEVLNKEVYCYGGTLGGTFGYQDRYDEYRRTESSIAGEFRETTLDYWHMARQFTGAPVLNSSFVESVPTKRVNAVQTNDVLWCMLNHSIQARRQLSQVGKSFIF